MALTNMEPILKYRIDVFELFVTPALLYLERKNNMINNKADENMKAVDVLINKIISIVDTKNEKLKYDKTFKATVWRQNNDGTYQISYLGQLYNVYNALGTDLELGQSVWVKIPGGIFRNMHICGVNYKKDTTR